MQKLRPRRGVQREADDGCAVGLVAATLVDGYILDSREQAEQEGGGRVDWLACVV